MVFDFKKALKEFYPTKTNPTLVKIPKMNFLAVRGQGDPNEEGGEYKQAISLLYPLAYTILILLYRHLKVFGGKKV